MFSQTDLEKMTLPELNELEKQLKAAKMVVQKKARAKMMEEIEKIAESYGISLEEVQNTSSRSKPVLPRYRNPEDPTETWSGRGRQPKWVKDHLEDNGNLDALLIENQP
jgi:DNA-binding protein H-NS